MKIITRTVALALGLSLGLASAFAMGGKESSGDAQATSVSTETATGGARESKAPASYSGKEGKITVYVSGPSAMLEQLEAAFEEGGGDVVDLVALGCGPLRQRVWAEAESGGIRADVFWGSDPLVYIALDKRGALERYRPAEYEAVKPLYRTDRSYVLVNERYGVVIYNDAALKGDRVPRSFTDLAAKANAGAVVLSDPTQSSTGLALVATLWDVKGRSWDLFKALAAGGVFLSKKNSDVPAKIMEGEFDLGVAPHDEASRIIAKAKKDGYPPNLAICWPEEGSLAIQRPIAISANPARPAVNEELARAFVDFMISKKAQSITAAFGFYSVRGDVATPKGMPAEPKAHRVDWEYLSEHESEIRDGFAASF